MGKIALKYAMAYSLKKTGSGDKYKHKMIGALESAMKVIDESSKTPANGLFLHLATAKVFF